MNENTNKEKLEIDFLNAKNLVENEIKKGLAQIAEIVTNLVKISEEHGIPFEYENDTYIPETYKKWEALDLSDEDWSKYDNIGWNEPYWKSSHC